MTKVMAAHQPNFLPYLGFFDKLKHVDEMGTEPGVFVIRCDCQFVRRDFHHRNRIRTNTGDGWIWIHVPVEESRVPIREIKIRHDKKIDGVEFWAQYHLRLMKENYRRTPFFDDYYPGLVEIYSDPGDSLCDFNIRLIKYIANCFGIGTKLILFRDLSLSECGTCASETIANIARAVRADTYLSGDGAKVYLDMCAFANDVRVEFQNYEHPVYPQRYPGFKPYMTALDALFNIGRLPRSGEVVNATTEVKC
jgi:hypothetical protein